LKLFPAAVLVAAACSSLPENGDGVATLEVRLPVNFFLEQDRPLTLRAVARNREGDSVGAVIAWRTPDSTVVVDSASGTVTARFATGQARIQAALIGGDPFATALDNLVFKLTPPADTLALTGPDSLDATTDRTGAQIGGLELLGGAPPAGVPGRPVSFRIVDPAPADSPTVVLGSASSVRVADSTATDANGRAGSMLVVAALGRTPPDRVVVEANAYRADGALIPGSGRRFVVRFRHQ
jgi:hypothetical protein